GDVIDPVSGLIIAGLRSADGQRIAGTMPALLRGDLPGLSAGMATTIGCIATDAVLTKAQAQKIAQMAHDGLARTIDPVHTQFDGDTLFTLATGASGLSGNPSALGAMAAAVTAAAVLRAVRAVRALAEPGLPWLPAAGDFDDPPARSSFFSPAFPTNAAASLVPSTSPPGSKP
ncbi:MAG: P1 family peptidase, partial [Alphaproteobacteria bacterium]|nr:P1 family peptidase [Alphaproteobacteria bacterium]